ncbi:hypothetical protein F7734_22575 [Scytonema sp. UIC 10036]|uniref:hypothetical protein n=1 Tax=Scytonema sp. UIC 10036 TaxID=2304196 RepID=UPI0012DA4FAB|nr:hypothetical protein [Scytonema sp. UIC 10036]MUG94994.1 hypothetical protein [Scytonema sp. UIC 10036]
MSEEAKVLIRMSGQEIENEIPVNILVRVLDGMQQIVYLLATAREKRSVGQRFRVPAEMQQLYSLRASIPQPGSYAVPVMLPSDPSSLDVMRNLESFLSCLSDFNFNYIQDIIPDSKLRNRALRETRRFLPKADETWQLAFSRDGSAKELTLTHKSIDAINTWLTQDIPEDAVMTLTGELIRIDFDKHLVVLRYPPTHQEIECIYREELEDSMIENRRQMIQVTGQFTLNDEGHPIKLTDVTRIEFLDLSPINIREISREDRKLRLKMHLVLTPEMDEESKQLLVVEEPQIGLHVFAYTRDELIHEINDQIFMMWDEYASADSDELELDARQLRESLLEKLEEVSSAATKG